MKKIILTLSQFFKNIFGQFQYSGPTWAKKIKTFIQNKIATNPQLYKKNFYRVLGLAAVVIAGLVGKHYYDNRPRPDAVSFKVSAISSYDFEKPEARPLFLTFDKSVANVNMIGKALNNEVQMKPEIKGQWIWVSDKELKFTPLSEKGKLDWPIGQKFTGTISRKVLSPNIELLDNDFEFETENIKATVSDSSFYQDPRFPDNKKVVATFRFNYPVDTESLKKRLQLLEKVESGFEGKSKYEITTSFDELKSKMYVTSSNIKIDNSNKDYKFVLDKGFSSIFGGQASDQAIASIQVPSLYDYFKMTSVGIVIVRNEKFESEQILRLENISEIASEELGKTLQVYELPYNSLDPSEQEKKQKGPYRWHSVSEVTSEVLAKSKKVEMKVIPTEQAISLQHSYRFSVAPGRSLYVKIPKDTTSFGGFKLKEDSEKVIFVPQYPSDLQIMGKGSLIPLSGSKQLSLVSRNINKIAYEVKQVRMEQVNHLIPGLVGDYAKPDSYEIREDRISEQTRGEIPLVNKNPQKSQFSSIDLSSFVTAGKKGLFLINVSSKNSPESVSDRRFVILTDIGMIVKKTVSGQFEVFVQNISTGHPVVGAKVSVMGQNGINVLSSDSNAQGMVSFPNLKDFKNDKYPIAFVAQSGESISFVPYESYSRELDMTSFDIGGIYDSSESDELNAFIFSDRGIYRPGETADFGLVVRSKNWGKAFTQIPVDIVIQNAGGQDVSKQTIKVSSNTMDSVNFKTEDYFQTGQYTIYAYVKDKFKNQMMIGSQTFQVEEFVPDQIKVRTSLSQMNAEGWVKPKDLKLNLTAFNLYGKPATERVAKSRLRIRAADVYFKKWKDYYFNVPKPNQLEIQDSLPDLKTNGNGEAEWTLNLDSLEKSIYRMNVDSEVFETEGGKSVKAQLSQLVSNQDYFLGFKAAQGSVSDFSFIKKSVPASLDLITVNSKLEAVASKDIEVTMIEKKPTSILTRLPNDTYAYQTVYKENVLKTFKVNVNAKATNLKLDTETVGEFILVFKDADKTELNRLVYNVVGNADLERGLEKSSLLKLGLNKKDYKPTEEIEVQIKAPYAGAGLITIERDKVYATKWFKASGKSTVEKIQIPAGLEGQAYVVVTMLRDQKSEEIYTSPLSYGVASFAIDLEARKSKIDISAPDKVKPGEKLSFKVKADQKTKAAIYLVDEGILQVASYKLPQPLNYFFQKKALQVVTAQILDLVMPDFNQLGVHAAGGDEAARLGQSINPFKRKGIPPVAYWLGIKDIGAEWSTFQYQVPDHFNGNLKVMVVTADDRKLGSTSTDVNVRGDFIISATASSFTAPGDEFEINLIIANQLKDSGADAKVELDIQTDNGYTLVDKKIEALAIPENKEKSFNFKIKATENLGSHPIVVTAGIGTKKAKVEINISNRPAVPHQQKIDWIALQDKAVELKPMTNVRPEFKKNYLQVHTSVQDLIKPFESFYEINDYLCTEQIASQLMPLVLKNEKSKDEVAKVNRLISLLRARQQTGGSFALYPEQEEVQADTSLHLGMVFLYMQEKGEPLPADMWNRYVSGLKSDYNQTSSSTDLYRKAKAIYILLRTQFVPKTDLKNMAAILNDKASNKTIASVTAYYLAASFKLAQQEDLAQKALALAEKNQAVKLNDQFSFDDSEEFEIAALLMRHFGQSADAFASSTFLKLIDRANARALNTYSSSYLLMSLDSLMKQSGGASLEKLTVKTAKADKTETNVQFGAGKQKKIDFDDAVSAVTLTNGNPTPMLLTYVQAGFDSTDKMAAKANGIEISRTFTDDSGQAVTSANIGSELTVKIRARTNLKKYSSILISDLLPAGFEVVLNSVRKNKLDAESTGDSGSEESGEEAPIETGEEGASMWPLRLMVNRAYAESVAAGANIPAMATDLIDVREDRVNIYVSLDQDMKEYTYKIKAIAKGKFVVPGIYARGLYRTDLTGQGASGTIEVK